MKVEALDRIAPALHQIGAVEIARPQELRSREVTYARYYRWHQWVIRTAWNVVDDLVVEIAPDAKPGELPKEGWRTIFSYTVAGFDDFDDERKLDWVLSVPSGPDYPDYMARHVLHLPTVLGATAA